MEWRSRHVQARVKVDYKLPRIVFRIPVLIPPSPSPDAMLPSLCVPHSAFMAMLEVGSEDGWVYRVEDMRI